MQGLELAKRYYEEVGRPMLERDFPELLPRLAAGASGASGGSAGRTTIHQGSSGRMHGGGGRKF